MECPGCARAGEPERKPYGLLADCVDDQGATFRLWQPADRPKGWNAAANTSCR